MNAEFVLDRLAQAPPPGQRRGPKGPEPGRGPGAGQTRPRGDHDLNPDTYDPNGKLVAAAVLVPIVVHETGLTVLFTRRTEHLYAHPGQISFPGGQIEPGDAGPEAAALRETEEETGLPRHCVRPVGTLDTYITRTGFEIVPVVGLVTPPFTLALDDFEVAEAFEVPLAFFLAPENLKRHSHVYEGRERYFHVFPYEDYFIWGATAGMLVNLMEILTADRGSEP